MKASETNLMLQRFPFPKHQGNEQLVDPPRDAIGRPVDSERAAAAVRMFAKIWEYSLFDCDAQDYEEMAEDILSIMAVPYL
jgi:hypothetical protein